jgi:hypothetical protein
MNGLIQNSLDAKQMYSEEEVLEILNDCRGENPIDIDKWFEQFKKEIQGIVFIK